jgi:hypothetical protein
MRIEFNLLQEERSYSNLLSHMGIPYWNENLLDVFLCPFERQEENRVMDLVFCAVCRRI